jgi:ferredoxin
MTRSFEELNSDYIDARDEWIVHTDHCGDCDECSFACEEGLLLRNLMNVAWDAAKRAWDRYKAEESLYADSYSRRGLIEQTGGHSAGSIRTNVGLKPESSS